MAHLQDGRGTAIWYRRTDPAEWSRSLLMRHYRARRYEIERRQQRLLDDHPAVHRLRLLREAVAKLTAVADAAREQNDRALYAALQALDETSGPQVPASEA